MATGRAFAAISVFHIISRKVPCPERHGITDMLGIVTRVNLVTGTAGSSFHGLIDMPKVQVLVSVAEVRERRRKTVEHQCSLVTAET